jgi:hypothetical protein
MLRLSLHLARRSSFRVCTPQNQQTWNQIRCFGISRHAHERWNDEEEADDSMDSKTDSPMISPNDMELYQYNPQAYLDQMSGDEAQDIEDKRQQKVRDELDMRTGRGWTDPWEISEAEWAAPTEHDDLPDWSPSSASKLSVDRVQLFGGGIPTLSELSNLPLPPPPPPHPSSNEARAFAAARKDSQYKYILGQVASITEPKVEEIKNLQTWEEKQDAVDELFEYVEAQLKDAEEILGRHPSFGVWVEKALEEYLESVQATEGDSEEKDELAKDDEAVPVFMELFDKNDEEGEAAPKVPTILRPLLPHPKDGDGHMVEEWELSAHDEARRIMLRQSTRQIARILDQNESFRVFVDGHRGVGKSAALLSVVAAARKSGHIVLFAPDGDRLRKYGHYIEPNPKHEGMFDLPLLSQEMCNNLFESHRRDLAGMDAAAETREKYLVEDLKKRIPDKYKDELSLAGLLQLAKEESVFAPMCYSTVVETLMNQEDKPFLIVLDEFNCYYDYGHYFHMDYDEDAKIPIPLDQISLFKPFMDAMGLATDPETDTKDPVPIKRGGVIVGVSENRAVARRFTDGLTASATKASKDIESKFPMHVVTVPRYSILEVEHILSNFDTIGVGRLRFDRGDTVIDEQEVSYLRMVSGSNGQLLLDACIV